VLLSRIPIVVVVTLWLSGSTFARAEERTSPARRAGLSGVFTGVPATAKGLVFIEGPEDATVPKRAAKDVSADPAGIFSIQGLAPGRYLVQPQLVRSADGNHESAGFPVEVVLAPSRRVRLDFDLRKGATLQVRGHDAILWLVRGAIPLPKRFAELDEAVALGMSTVLRRGVARFLRVPSGRYTLITMRQDEKGRIQTSSLPVILGKVDAVVTLDAAQPGPDYDSVRDNLDLRPHCIVDDPPGR